MKIGFIGLGHMGGPMAKNLLKHGHTLKVFDMVPDAIKRLTGSRGSKLGDLGPYGKQVIQFYTQTKTVTERWFDDSSVNTGVNTTISLK